MGRLKSLRLKATTIIESMVAMVIIVVSFGIAMMIYMNVLSTDQLSPQTKADILLQEEMVETKKNRRFFKETKEIDGILLEKEVLPYPGSPDAYVIVLTMRDAKGKIIREVREIVYATLEKN